MNIFQTTAFKTRLREAKIPLICAAAIGGVSFFSYKKLQQKESTHQRKTSTPAEYELAGYKEKVSDYPNREGPKKKDIINE